MEDLREHSFLVQYFNLANAILSIVIYSACSILLSIWRAPRYPTSIPWVGHGKSWRAMISNTFGAFQHSREWLTKGYNEHGKKGKAFVLPSSIGQSAEIIIPRTQMRWMLDQPDSVLSTSSAHYDLLHGEYSFVTPQVLKDPYHEHVIHKNLTRNLNALIPDLDDEVCKDVDDYFGMDNEWHSINLLNTFMKLVPKITNRMVVGKPLCQNKDFLRNMEGFTNDVIRGFLIFGLTPEVLHPIIGLFAGLMPKYHYLRTCVHSLPLVKKRLHDIKQKEAGNPEYKTWEAPNDFVTWTIKTAMAEGREDEYDPWRVALRLLPINFASIHTTALTGHGALLDILSSDPSVLEDLREEASRIFREEGNSWTKPGLARMYRMDSAIRESQRYSGIALTFVHRKVMVKEGIVTPDGTHIAYGTIVSCCWGPLGFDEDIYSQPDKYDAFRFSRDREAYEAKAPDEKDQKDGLKLRQSSLVTTSDKHLAFSHGRHACPGRFFVSHELKMLFAYLILNYDIKNIDERPKTMWLGRNQIPAAKACIEVRRRKTT